MKIVGLLTAIAYAALAQPDELQAKRNETDYRFIDLEKNGVYDLVAYKERRFDQLRQPTTPLLGKHYVVMASLYDIDRDGSAFIAPPGKVLCAMGCPPFCTDAYTKGPPCAGNEGAPR